MPQRAVRLVHGLDAHAVVADLPGAHQVVEDAEHLRPIVHLRVRAVELEQVDRVHLQVPQATINPPFEVLAAVALGRLRRQAAARFRRHVDRLALALATEARHQPLAAPVAVDVGRVDEVGAGVDRGVEGAHRLLVVDGAPCAADRPGAEADRRDLHVRPSEPAVFHVASSSGDLHALAACTACSRCRHQAPGSPPPQYRQVAGSAFS
jgi:hypothetical protein